MKVNIYIPRYIHYTEDKFKKNVKKKKKKKYYFKYFSIQFGTFIKEQNHKTR